MVRTRLVLRLVLLVLRLLRLVLLMRVRVRVVRLLLVRLLVVQGFSHGCRAASRPSPLHLTLSLCLRLCLGPRLRL